MADINVSALTMQVLWAAFIASALFGAIAQRTHFCTMGAVSDLVNMGDATRMRQWALAVGVAMIGFWLLAVAGQIDPTKTIHSTPRWMWASGLVGGLLFGFGMVLGSGCGSKTLIRIGTGNLKSLVVFLALGVASFATLKGVTAVARVATVDKLAIDFGAPAQVSTLAAGWLGMKTPMAGLVVALVLGGLLVLWALARRDFWNGNNLLAGVGVGGVIVAMWWITGHLGHLAEHPETLDEVFLATNSGRAEALSFVAPVAYTLDWLMFFSDKNKVLTVGVVSVLGVIAGACVMSLIERSFRWEGFRSTEDLVNHLVGGALMGVGGVTALGCTVGQGLTGLSALSATAFVAVPAIIAGAVAALKYQIWRLERMA